MNRLNTKLDLTAVWDSVVNSVENSANGTVSERVSDLAWVSVVNSVENSVMDSARVSVRDSVSNLGRDSVGNSIWDSVMDSVWTSVRDLSPGFSSALIEDINDE